MDHGSKPEKVYAIRPNKTQLKKEHDLVKKFVVSLIKKTPPELKKLPLDEAVLDQIYLAQKIKGSAYSRQIKHIANQLVKLGEETLESLISGDLKKVTAPSKKTLQIKQILEQLIERPDSSLEQTLTEYPQLDRQKLRTLVLQIRREQQKNLPAKAQKTLTKYLHEQIH